MAAFPKTYLALASPLVGYFLPGIVIPLISTAPSASSDFSILYPILIIAGSALLCLISYVYSAAIYPKIRFEFETSYQEGKNSKTIPLVMAITLSLIIMFFGFKSCNFSYGCYPVPKTITALAQQIIHNNLHLRTPHMYGFSYLGAFIGYSISLTIIFLEVISRIIYGLKK